MVLNGSGLPGFFDFPEGRLAGGKSDRGTVARYPAIATRRRGSDPGYPG